MRSLVNRAVPYAALILMSMTIAAAKAPSERQSVPATGPAADYPVVVGEPFTIGTTVWTPVDQLNYDAVGYAIVDNAGLAGVTGAHKTLPLPSYVEVTALDTGKTILVRVERRGPMTNDALMELSAGAAAQLGLSPGARSSVRVRRVNPPEQERAMLRAGARAPERMETPEGLLKVLRRRLTGQSPLVPPPSTPPAMPTDAPPLPPVKSVQNGTSTTNTLPAKQAAANFAGTAAKPTPKPGVPKQPAPTGKPSPKPGANAHAGAATEAVTGRRALTVQVAALSVEANARKLADRLGGRVSPVGKVWRVRLGPFANRAQAAEALEKAKRAGYSDARIQSAD